MPIPDYQTLMLPVLRAAKNGEAKISDVIPALAEDFKLTPEERAELLPSGRITLFANRVHWAKTYLKQAGLIEPTRRAHFLLTQRGKDALAEHLKEHRWLWGPVMRLTPTCDVPHGQSGGPVLRLDSNQVIGVMGTASDGNATPCELNNPCVVKADGAVFPTVKDQGYAHFVHRLYTCLDADRDVNLETPGCLLPTPKRQ